MADLQIAADVLRCFSTERPTLSMTEVATLLGLPKSNASRLLRAMRDAGFLEIVGPQHRYRPGLVVFETGRLFRSQSTLLARADEVVARVSAKVGHTGFVSLRDGADVLGLTHHPGRGTLRVVTPTGRRLAAFASATGRALLASLTNAEIEDLHRPFPRPPSPTAPQSITELMARVEQARRDGFAESHDESNRGVGAIAVGVSDPDSGEALAMCIAYPAAMITADEREAITHDLRAGARTIAAAIGEQAWAGPSARRLKRA